MKNLLIGLMIVLATVNAKADFLGSLGGQVASTSASKQVNVSEAQFKALMVSDKAVCFKTKDRRIVFSKGYEAQFGGDKSYCTTAMAKKFGITRLGKNSFTKELTIKLIKAGLI